MCGCVVCRYILRSLTKKHCDVLKHVIKMQEREATKINTARTNGSSSSSSSSGSSSSGSSNTTSDDKWAAPVGDSLFGALPTKKPAGVVEPRDKSAGAASSRGGSAQISIKWNELLAVCTSQLITKNDIEMRKLICKCGRIF